MPSQPPPLKYKIISYAAAWLLALFATDPSLGFWSLAYMFPLGLFGFFFPSHRQDAGWGVLAAGVGLYLVHALFFFRARTHRGYYVLLGLLIALLACNISGCRQMIHVH